MQAESKQYMTSPVVAIKLAGQPARPQLAKRPEELLDVFAGGLKGHIAHHQLGAGLFPGSSRLLLLRLGCASRLVTLNLAHAQLHAQLVTIQK